MGPPQAFQGHCINKSHFKIRIIFIVSLYHFISLFALLFVTKSKSQRSEMLGDGSTHHIYNITESCPARPGGEPSYLCHWNPWLEPNELKILHWLVSLTKCLAIFFFLGNSLLRTSTRHLVQRDPNQRKKIIWSLTVSNHQKKHFHSPRVSIHLGEGTSKRSNVVRPRLLSYNSRKE